MNGGKGDRGAVTEEKARNNEIIRKDPIERECMKLRLERKEKMKRIEIRRKMGVEKARSKTRVAQEYHALCSPKLTNYIDQYFFLIDLQYIKFRNPPLTPV